MTAQEIPEFRLWEHHIIWKVVKFFDLHHTVNVLLELRKRVYILHTTKLNVKGVPGLLPDGFDVTMARVGPQIFLNVPLARCSGFEMV